MALVFHKCYNLNHEKNNNIIFYIPEKAYKAKMRKYAKLFDEVCVMIERRK